MRYIYVDEAGTSENEPVTVVLGIIVHADTQYLDTERKLADVIGTVPAELRGGFVAHATRVWNDQKLRPVWSMERRIDFLRAMVGIVNDARIPFCVAMTRRTNRGDPCGVLSRADFHHQWAFGLCIAHADRYVRERAGANEVATVVAEDCPEKRRVLRSAAKRLTDQPVRIRARVATIEGNRETVQQDGGAEYRIERVKDTIHFAAKTDGPFLQIADACAFAWRRFFNSQDLGEELVRAMIGSRDVPGARVEQWAGMYGSATFAFHPDGANGPDRTVHA